MSATNTGFTAAFLQVMSEKIKYPRVKARTHVFTDLEKMRKCTHVESPAIQLNNIELENSIIV